jgi:hypothetical protein
VNAPQKKITPSVEDALSELDKLNEQRTTNLRIWDTLGKTDPAHTKQFSRAGGFKGTAIKPIWITKRLTEQFGPCGEGWGIGEPKFQVETTLGGETLVYCTVSCWHGSLENRLFGVGGDKVVTHRRDGTVFCDDEAFKKAFTDAVGNAFKFIGVGADVHMGLFEDSKYLAEVKAEFHPKPDKLPEDLGRGEGEMSSSALRASLRMLVHHINGSGSVTDLEDILDTEDAKEVIDNCQRRFPAWWETGEGMPAEFVPLKKLIEQTRHGLKQLETQE